MPKLANNDSFTKEVPEDLDEKVSQSSEVMDFKEAEFLAKLKSLRVNCDELHTTLKAALITSGVCKKYTNSTIVVSKPSKIEYNVGTDKDGYMFSPPSPNPTPECSDSDLLQPIQEASENSSNEAIEEVPAQARETKQCITVKHPPAARLLTALRAEKRQRQLRKFLQRKKELSLRPHLVPLRLKYGNGKGLSRKNGTTTSKHSLRSRQKHHTWVPRRTIPEPFVFTLREAEAPIRANYAKKFLEEMLDEKMRKEEADLAEYRKQFRAKAPPRTTYISDSNYFVRQIRKPRTKSAPPGLKLKALSEPALNNVSRGGSREFRARPVPITTYIRPSTVADELRAAAKTQRAVEMLIKSRAPFCIADHTMRTHVQNNIRHRRTCYGTLPTFTPNITKSVPDFRMLHMEFSNKIAEARERRLPTMAVPFRFRQDTVPRHSCENMREHPSQMNSTFVSVRSVKSSDTYSVQ
uniref:TPX2 domain-containing protein n=1 Tax=Panagrellus redivivus TaxID=6233 RepID=A0A7E4VYW9_PANRE